MRNKRMAATVIALIALPIMSSCSALLGADIAENVSVDNTIYQTGFYGDLWPQNLEQEGDTFTIDGTEYQHVKNDRFDWIHSQVGLKECGILYCNADQFRDAQAYYNDPKNFRFYCRVNNNSQKRIQIDNFDTAIFDALTDFAQENNYEPFDIRHNEKVKTMALPIPDFSVNPPLVFYKDSTDGFFTSFKGYSFHIIDGTLYYVYYYDYGKGKYEEMRCTAVPQDIGQYIIRLSEEYSFSSTTVL